MKFVLTLTIFGLAVSPLLSGDPPANSELVVDESFDSAELAEGWTIQTGSWTIIDGSLVAAEIESDHHSAAARRVVETGNAVYEMQFMIGEKTKAFHFGFDPIRGALDKKGHLFSVIITPNEWKILKHVDKNKRLEDPNEVLARAKHNFALDQWHELRVVTWETTVKATIDDLEPLTAAHPTFSVKKPTLVFRAIGEDVEIDDLKVWTQQG